MGLFSFVGKAIKGIGKVAGTALKVAGAAGKLGIPIPGAGLAGKLAQLVAAKRPMTAPAQMIPPILQGSRKKLTDVAAWDGQWSAPVLRASPVMPGGAVATASGMAPAQAVPPRAFGGTRRGTSAGRRKRRTTRATWRRKPRRGMLGGRRMTAKQAKYFGKRKRRTRRAA